MKAGAAHIEHRQKILTCGGGRRRVDKIGVWGRDDEALDHLVRRSPELDYWDGER